MDKNPDSENIFTKKYTVRSYETDFTRHASFQAISGYMQDTALHHVQFLDMGIHELQQQNITWLLSRIKTKIFRSPAWNEELTVQTWSPEIDRLYAHREFNILDKQNEVIVQASSLYILLDIKSLRPISTKHVLGNFNQFFAKRHFPEIVNRMKISDNHDFIKSYEVSIEDIDLNDHVNNLKYIRWVLDSVPLEIRRSYYLETFEINYQNSAVLSDFVNAYIKQIPDDRYHFEHSLLKESNGAILVTARSMWQKL